MGWKAIYGGVGICLSLGACGGQTLSSMSPPVSDRAVTGVPYFLPRAFVPITFKGGPPVKDKDGTPSAAGAYQVESTIGTTTFIGDPSAPLFLAYRHSGWADDHFNVAVDQNGLLQTSSTSSSDRSGAIALKVIEFIGQLAQAAGGFPGPVGFRSTGRPKAAAKPVACLLPPFTQSFPFFPDRGGESRLVEGGGDQQLTVSVSLISESGIPGSGKLALEPAGETDGARREGVVFRKPKVIAYRIKVSPNAKASAACGFGVQESEQFATVPDTSPGGLFWQDMSRATLVKKDIKLGITNGMLTSLDVESPSEILAIVSLPVDMLKALLAIPASVLTFKVQQLQAEQGWTDAQAKAIQSQIELQQKNAALQQALAAGTQQ